MPISFPLYRSRQRLSVIPRAAPQPSEMNPFPVDLLQPDDRKLEQRHKASAQALLAILLCLAMLAPAACTASKTPTPDPRATDMAPVVAIETPDPDTIIWGLASRPGTLDAARLDLDPELAELDPAGIQVASQIYDRLVQYRPGTNQLAPGIAESWQANVRENTYTFTLRDDLVFHDGSRLDARAVAWNFERWMNPRHPEHRGDFRVWEGLFGYVGQKDGEDRDAFIVESVEAIGPLQVRFQLRAPFAPFLYHLALVPLGLASPGAVRAQGEDYGSDGDHLPVGSGPYRALAWDEQGLRLAPFREHWAGPPANSGLRFIFEADDGARAASLAAGDIHGTVFGPTMPVTGSLASKRIKLEPRPARSSAWLMLDHSRNPLDSARVRRAISLAIDRDALVRDHFGVFGQPASQLIPPDFLGHDPQIPVDAHDPEASRTIFKEEGISGTFRLNIWIADAQRSYMPDPEGAAQSVASMLETIGISTTVRTLGLRQFLTDRQSGRFTAWMTGWEAQSSDPDNFWFWHFGIPNRVIAEGQYDNPELRANLVDAQRADTDSRREIYEASARTVYSDTARIFLAHARPIIAMSIRLNGVETSAMGFESFSEARLSPQAEGTEALATLAPFGTPLATPISLEPLAPTPDETAEAAGTPQSDEEDQDGVETDVAGTENASP